MERYSSTGQSPQRAVAPKEEKEEVNVCSVEGNRRRPCMCVGRVLVLSSNDSEKGVDSPSRAAQPYDRTDPFRSAEISVTIRE